MSAPAKQAERTGQDMPNIEPTERRREPLLDDEPEAEAGQGDAELVRRDAAIEMERQRRQSGPSSANPLRLQVFHPRLADGDERELGGDEERIGQDEERKRDDAGDLERPFDGGLVRSLRIGDQGDDADHFLDSLARRKSR